MNSFKLFFFRFTFSTVEWLLGLGFVLGCSKSSRIFLHEFLTENLFLKMTHTGVKNASLIQDQGKMVLNQPHFFWFRKSVVGEAKMNQNSNFHRTIGCLRVFWHYDISQPFLQPTLSNRLSPTDFLQLTFSNRLYPTDFLQPTLSNFFKEDFKKYLSIETISVGWIKSVGESRLEKVCIKSKLDKVGWRKSVGETKSWLMS